MLTAAEKEEVAPEAQAQLDGAETADIHAGVRAVLPGSSEAPSGPAGVTLNC